MSAFNSLPGEGIAQGRAYNFSIMIHIEQIRPELTWRSRQQVLYPAQKLYEMELDEDNEGIHFGAFTDDKLVGIISLFQQGTSFQFRKLAVLPEFQKMGIGN